MRANDSSTPQLAAERNRRQREHARTLRVRTALGQFWKRRRAETKLAKSRERLQEEVLASQRRGLLARVKALQAAESSRTTASRQRERADALSLRQKERSR